MHVRHCSSSIVLAAALACCATLTHRAAAQEDAATEMARDRFKEGVRYYDQKQYEKARAAFLQAYALKKHPAVLLNLAQSELRSGHEADAATHFAQYLRENVEAADAERRDAEKGLAAAKEKVAQVQVNVSDAGADVLVDGESHGKAPLPGALYLTPGTHRIEARKGDLVREAEVEAAAGATQSVTLTLAAPEAQKRSAPVAGRSLATDEEVNTTDVELDRSGGRESFFSWFGHTPLAWLGAGVTVGGAAGAIGFGLAARNRYDSADKAAEEIRFYAQRGEYNPSDRNAPCANPSPGYVEACGTYVDRVDSGDTYKTFAIVSGSAAGAAAVLTIVYYFVDADSEPASTASVRRPVIAPVIAPNAGGVSISGAF
jgi:tetratricopeptide (TPR) repeat protein